MHQEDAQPDDLLVAQVQAVHDASLLQPPDQNMVAHELSSAWFGMVIGDRSVFLRNAIASASMPTATGTEHHETL